MSEEVYIIGHMNPDTDSICSAIAYAEFKKQAGSGGNYIAARIGELNSETAYVLDRFGFSEPVLLEDGAGKKIILVDHNEESQSIDGYAEAEIVEVIDHHKINFRCSEPIVYRSEPLGSTATILGEMFLSCMGEVDKGVAGLLLSAILSDTVVFRSVTTTDRDVEVANKMAEIAGIDDVTAFGIEVKMAKSSLEGLSAKDVIFSDFKDFDFNGSKVGVGQIEVVDGREAVDRGGELIDELGRIKLDGGYDLLVLMVTNIMEAGSDLMVVGLTDRVEEAFKAKVENNKVYLRGVMSRKKQVVPQLKGVF
ncbi:MAG: manganese-dependent inorganic pyrophosphatase [Candidatus Altiarchaeota archaeon]|nr:manganese-dependent inorganic pyrophosphatase [Candidatus Altiarchaeota archaeon]